MAGPTPEEVEAYERAKGTWRANPHQREDPSERVNVAPGDPLNNDPTNHERIYKYNRGTHRDQVFLDQQGYNNEVLDSLLETLSQQLLGGNKDLEDYFENGISSLFYTYLDVLPSNPGLSSFFLGSTIARGTTAEGRAFLDAAIALPDKYQQALKALYSPYMGQLLHVYSRYKTAMEREVLERVGEADNPLDLTFQEMMDTFGEPGVFTWAGSNKFKDTGEMIEDVFRNYERPNTPPSFTLPWEMRIGATKFAVPPINVNVYQSFKAGSLSGGAIRQMNTPKFNSGRSETMIEVTLYFPNQESVWGFEGDSLIIDLMDKNATDEVLDRYLSSLRGLVTQFKYAPFLPVRNQYLNQVYDITAVALQSMTVSTMENFPFCLSVTLQLQKFNHKVFLPTVRDFNTAIHWGRFRQYMVAAAQQMNKVINKGFLVRKRYDADPGSVRQAENGDKFKSDTVEEVVWERPESVEFNKNIDFNEGKHFDIYFPERTPAKVYMAEYGMFRAEGENDYVVEEIGRGWTRFLQDLGYNPTSKDISYDRIKDQVLLDDRAPFPTSDQKLIAQFFVDQTVDSSMMAHLLENFEEYYTKLKSGSDKPMEEMNREARENWFRALFNKFVDQDFLEKARSEKASASGEILIREWMVPMAKVVIDWDKVHVTGVTTTIGNNFAKLQLQMEEDPVLQHIGGLDSQVNVNMVVFGESELIKWKRMFSHVNNLAQLEHAHGVMGFLGIKNVVTALCGIKYVLPLDFSVETIPGFPNVYNITMSFVDFDVEQQKREELSNEQQRRMTEQFSKRNPFLRVKQVWGSFNAYPDFPLSVTDDKGNIVGHLDPDYYFRAFDTWDDDLLKHGTLRTVEDIDRDLQEARDTFDHMPLPAADRASITKDLNKERDVTRYFQILKELEHLDGVETTNLANDVEARKSRLREERDGIIARLGWIPVSPTLLADYSRSEGSLVGDKVSKKLNDEHKVRVALGVSGEDQGSIGFVDIHGETMDMGSINRENPAEMTPVYKDVGMMDSNGDRTNNASFAEELTPLSGYQNAYTEHGTSYVAQYEQIAYDTRYRDVSGRMLRAFPTYMLWLIDEGGRFTGVKLFDNFYGLQSVIDFSVVQSEDILGDTLVLRLSNLYRKLTTPSSDSYIFGEQGDEGKSSFDFINTIYRDIPRNVNSGTLDNYLVDLNSIRLKPGVRLHLRIGYGSNPNALQTVFNGTITSVTAGEIVEVVAQSDAIELSAIVNTTNTKGDSSDVDGSMFTGMWLSEPRDLMVRLLSMGTSQWREYYAAATQGKIFSENKWGIRHFGSVLYEPMNEDEKTRQEKRSKAIDDALGDHMSADDLPNPDGLQSDAMGALKGSAGAIRFGAVEAIKGLFNGLDKERDIEIFKRNIYPGNGTGIAQYLGADTMNGGDILAGADAGTVNIMNAEIAGSPTAEEPVPAGAISLDEIRETMIAQDAFATSAVKGYNSSIASGDNLASYRTKVFESNPIMRMIGISSGDDDDVKGQDEVSFRASTYMKTIWDLFQVCAGLLPNYVVAVRPFEDRSTVFYGKPHWLYTSGVIPLSLGVPNDGSSAPAERGIDDANRKMLEKLADMSSSLSDASKQLGLIKDSALPQGELLANAGAVAYTGGEGTPELEITYNGTPYKLSLPFYDKSKGWDKLGIEMHLPTNGPHEQFAGLPDQYKHPYYMDRADPGDRIRGGRTPVNKNGEGETILKGERESWPGRHGAFGILDPKEEMYYICARWDYSDGGVSAPDPLPKDGRPRPPQGAYKYQRVLVVNDETGLACVCAVGEYGPYYGGITTKGVMSGAPPDVHLAIGNVDYDSVACSFSWLPPGTTLGPTTGTGIGTQAPSTVSNLPIPDADKRGGTTTSTPSRAVTTGDSGSGSGGPVGYLDAVRTLNDADGEDEGPYAAAYAHWSMGWKDSVDVWYEPWGSEYGEPDLDDFANANTNDNVTKEAFDALKEWIAKDPDEGGPTPDGSITALLSAARRSTDNGAWGKLLAEYSPFGPDPVAIAARRFYDHEYNERLVAAEEVLESAGITGFASQAEVYNMGANFLGSDGSPLSEGHGLSAANEIWDNFRNLWVDPLPSYAFSSGSDDEYLPEIEREEIRSAFEKLKQPGLPGRNGVIATIPNPPFSDPKYFVIDKGAKDSYMEADQQGTPALVENEQEFKENYNKSIRFVSKVVQEFVQFMWQDPYARAWLVITTNGNDDFDHRARDADNWRFNESPVTEALEYYLAIRELNDRGHPLLIVEPVDNQLNDVQQAMLGWLRQHNTKGGSVSGLDDIVGDAVNKVTENIGKIWRAIAIGFSGLFSLYEQAIDSYGEAFERVMAAQRRANVLNAAYNDSIYYAAGAPGSLLRLADNPFTREYGEPVVEIREPFQRLHYANSFQHIISNGIQENFEGIYTAMTVTSDGKYPITVFFDKGMPPDKQVEGFADTGIFWDNAKGSGFFGFLQPMFHPIETLRGMSKVAFGSSDELSSKRIGIYHLKESLKDIYQGELVLLGNADIRPWDLMYIGDVYERMYGMFEVEQVIHHFTPETGFITSITPNALVIANDPGRWSALTWLNSWMGIKNIRDDVRNMTISRSSDSSPIAKGQMTLADLVASLGPQVKGQVQYTHGAASLTKDLMGHLASGYAYTTGFQEGKATTSDFDWGGLLGLAGGQAPILGMFHEIAWDFWEWVRDSLADQQDCYINYLTKDGKPMDAGVSYASGVAVGTHHSYNLLPGILGFEFDVAKDGNRRITIEDLLGNLGYNERDIISIRRNTSLWISRTNARILQTAGTSPDDLPFMEEFDVITGTVEGITDADTIDISGSRGKQTIRLSGIATPELPFYASQGQGLYDSIPMDHPGKRGERYLASILPVGSPVAIRFSARTETETFSREAGVVFHNTPAGTAEEDKRALLERYARQKPMVTWDSYLDDGRPHTVNWAMIMAGHSPVNFQVSASYKNRSAEGASAINPVSGDFQG